MSVKPCSAEGAGLKCQAFLVMPMAYDWLGKDRDWVYKMPGIFKDNGILISEIQ